MKKKGFLILEIIAVSFIYSIIIGVFSPLQNKNNSNLKINNLSKGLSLNKGNIYSQTSANNIYINNTGSGNATGLGTGSGGSTGTGYA